MEHFQRKRGTGTGPTLALLLLLMTLAAGRAGAAPVTDPDFTTPIVNPADLQKYVSPLPNAYLLQIAPDTATYPGEDYYRVDMGQFNHDMKLLLNPGTTGYPAAAGNKLPLTPSWGYSLVPPTATTPATYYFPGPTIVNTQGRPSRVTWTNSLPPKHVIGLDPTLACGPPTTAGNVNGPLVPFTMNSPNCAPENRVVVHTHGAHVWDDSDGDPLAWFSNGFAVTGETWKPNTQYGPVGTYRYINDQEAGTIWYHDHAMGLTHVNVYAGLAGFFLITDANEANLRATRVLPQYKAATSTTPAETYEIPIALQDRKFYPDGTLAMPNNPVLDDTATIGPNVPCDATVGALPPYACTGTNPILPATTLCDPAGVINAYMCPAAKFSKAVDGSLIPYDPTITDPLRAGPFTAPSITPEFFGNVAIANGIVWPKQDTEQRKYRIRLLNGTDSRTYFLKFDNPLVKTWQIGTDQAFLDKPVDRSADYIILMPGERIDLIVDFAAVPVGTRVLWQNYGPTATADGLPPSPANPLLDIPYDGVLPVAGQPLNPVIPDVLAFDIIAMNPAVPDATITLATPLRPVPAFSPYPSLVATPGTPVRKLALIERGGSHGRFMLTLDGRDFMDPNSPITELPRLGDTEIWEIANFTPDAHPMHLHLVAFQLINRQEFSIDPASPTTIYDQTPGLPPFTRFPLMPYTPMPTYQFMQQIPGDLNYAPLPGGTATVPLPPDPWETGSKDTIQTLPGTVTRIIAKFDLPGLYVWHCHILSHEENDMMRPFIVTTPVKSVTATLTRNGVPVGSTESAAQAAPITITAQGITGLTGPAILSPQFSNGFEYQFSITDPGGVTSVLQPFVAWMYPMLDNVVWTPPKNVLGTYTIRVDARQAAATPAGTAGEVLPAQFTTTYTLTGPAISGATSTTANGYYKAGDSINVTLAFNQAITSSGLAITLNDGSILNTGALSGVSSYSGSYTVAAGQDTPAGQFLNISAITGSISDGAGNATIDPVVPAGANIANSSQITIDTTLPSLALTAPTATVVNIADQTVSGTATDPASIQSVTVNGTEVTVAAGGAFTATVTLAMGANTITVVATDPAGNATTVTHGITLSTTLPSLSLTSPAADYVNVANQTVSGTATSTIGLRSVTVNGTEVQVAADGTFSTPLTLVSGENTITVVVTDLADNATTAIRFVTLDTLAPVTAASPPPGTYSKSVTVTLAANEDAKIFFTTDGTVPTTASTVYVSPIVLASPTTLVITLNYFAVDRAGNMESVKTGVYTLHTTDLKARIAINNGRDFTNATSVSLSLSAQDKLGLKAYAISVDGGATYLPTVAITPPVPNFNKKVMITLPAGDGLKTVLVKFTDKPGVVYAPVSDQITLDTKPATTSVTPLPGNYPGSTLTVALSATENATTYYTTNGKTPTTASPIYRFPFTIKGANSTVLVKYFSVDRAGNREAVQTATYVFGHLADMTATFNINSGAKYTNTKNVLLSFTASDPVSGGVASMSFSNDGINYTKPAPYAPATAMPWTITPGDALKTVYVRFVDRTTPANTYTYTSQIFLAEGVRLASGDIDGNGKVDRADFNLALKASTGLKKLTIAEQARGDVAPLVNGKPQPDGKITSKDALVILKIALGQITLKK